MKTLFLTLVLCLIGNPVLAQTTVYIRDELLVPLRSGQTQTHRIVHKGLISGTPMTLLETNEESGYSRVTTPGGIEGWIQTQYITDKPVAKALLKRTQQELAQLQHEHATLAEKFKNATGVSSEYITQATQLQTENHQLKEELAHIKSAAANAIKLDADNQALLLTVEELNHQVDVYKSENARLRDDHESEAFLNGAFAVLLGVMITLLAPRLLPKRKSEWK